MIRYFYALLLLTGILIEASDLKEIERKIQAKDLENRIALTKELMEGVQECQRDACEVNERDQHMREFLSWKERVEELEKDLSKLQ